MITRTAATIPLFLFFTTISVDTGPLVVFETSGADQDEVTYSKIYNKNSGMPSNRTCNCITYFLCHYPPSDGSGVIDIRIITKPPTGITCNASTVYCCITISPQTTTQKYPVQTCGTRTLIHLHNYNLQPGQAPYGKYPWSALMLTSDNHYIGGGVLIGPVHLLTAAHKIQPYINMPGTKARLGEWDIAQDFEPYGYQEYGVWQITVHPNFNPQNLKNDIAVITLSKQVPLGVYPNINAACMAPMSTVFTGQRCWVAGWGKDAFGPKGQYQSILKEVNVPVLSTSDCNARLQTTRLSNNFQLDPNSFICAGGESGHDACTGDGGSAMVCDVNGLYHVAGIVSWGIGCGNNGVPGVYINVNNYQKWITDQITGY